MKIIAQNQSNEKLHFAVLRTQKLVNRNEETCSQIWRPYIPKSENWFDSRTQNIFRILLNLGRFENEIGGVLGRFAPKTPPSSVTICESFKRIRKYFVVIRSPDFAAIFTISVDKLLSSQLQQNKAFHLTDFHRYCVILKILSSRVVQNKSA